VKQSERVTVKRCEWCGDHPLYVPYHDDEWGVPDYDDQKLFEMVILEGAQAGLSWLTILKKRENYRAAFDSFDAEKIVQYDEKDIARLMGDAGIVRNRLKIAGAVKNARAFLAAQEEFGSFSELIWRYVDGAPIQNSFKKLADIPATTDISDRMSKDLKKRGFTFVGSTICYAFMQSVGMVNDHLVSCYRWKEIRG
jgi:DNA-3-methyladenine glycosylase I